MPTRILHTADVHLTPDAPERTEALAAVLELAEDEDVDVVTVGGDLFDAPEDVETLRADLRNDLFADRPFDVLLIPGNHDVEAYRGDVFFGDSCTVLTDDPFEHWTAPAGDVRITGLPYREEPDEELLLALQDREPFDGTEILLLHCSLEAPFDDYETGDEDTVLVNGGPDDLVALTFLDGDGLAGDHRLVNSALPVDDDAVGRDLFAGTDLHAVAHGDILQWHFHFDTVLVDEGGRLGLHFEEFPKGVTCLPFRAGFEIVAERDEHEDQRGSVEVQTPRDQSGKYRD
jgi:DNA repair exonuclease